MVLITGASRGIGAACADAFEQRGAKLSLLARSFGSAQPASPTRLITEGDITDPAVRQHAMQATLQRFGKLDILVNNAGFGVYGSTADVTAEDTRRLFEVNFFAPLALMQLAIPLMRQQGKGLLVNISSVAGAVPLPWMTLYSATKSALDSITAGLRMELRHSGIGTLLICPGYVKTSFHDHAQGQPPPRVRQAKRFAITPEQCALAVVRGVEQDARTVITPRVGWLMVGLHRILPGLVDSRLSKFLP